DRRAPSRLQRARLHAVTEGAMTSRAGLQRPVAARGALGFVLPRGLAATALSAALAASASRPWGLGVLALVAYLPALDAITSARTARGGALLAALASLGLASVAYEA